MNRLALPPSHKPSLPALQILGSLLDRGLLVDELNPRHPSAGVPGDSTYSAYGSDADSGGGDPGSESDDEEYAADTIDGVMSASWMGLVRPPGSTRCRRIDVKACSVCVWGGGLCAGEGSDGMRGCLPAWLPASTTT